ncbi:hypothetical protein AB0F85_05215 [Nocardia fluminea]|uniref:hypothetical protein n=1 Tax=Nocardia fluminea TaxID=134984 RepID=UPI0033D86BA8
MSTSPDVNARAELRTVYAAFRAAPAPRLSDLVGDHEGQFAGPLWLRSCGPLTVAVTGMRGWCGKSFTEPDDSDVYLRGVNLVRRRGTIEPSIPITAQIGASRVDGEPALIVSYPATARFPWNRVTDELRPFGSRRLLGLTFGIPGGPAGGAPFVLHRRESAGS